MKLFAVQALLATASAYTWYRFMPHSNPVTCRPGYSGQYMCASDDGVNCKWNQAGSGPQWGVVSGITASNPLAINCPGWGQDGPTDACIALGCWEYGDWYYNDRSNGVAVQCAGNNYFQCASNDGTNCRWGVHGTKSPYEKLTTISSSNPLRLPCGHLPDSNGNDPCLALGCYHADYYTLPDYSTGASAGRIPGHVVLYDTPWVFTATITRDGSYSAGSILSRHRSGCGGFGYLTQRNGKFNVRGQDTGFVLTLGQSYDVMLKREKGPTSYTKLYVDGALVFTYTSNYYDDGAQPSNCALDSADGGGHVPLMVGAHYWNNDYYHGSHATHFMVDAFTGTITNIHLQVGIGETDTPTTAPTLDPTANPTDAPTVVPTDAPTVVPTDAPTVVPTDAPTSTPTAAPTQFSADVELRVLLTLPTDAPTADPTAAPTAGPTAAPTNAPTGAPTDAPTAGPTAAPTSAPTVVPTGAPTGIPSEYIAFDGDCGGNNLASFTASYQQCIAHCNSNGQCVGFAHDGGTSCHIKHSSCSNVSSPPGSHTFYQKVPSGYSRKNGDCATNAWWATGGSDILPVLTVSFEGCAIACNADSNCAGFAYRASDSRCVLKAADCSEVVSEGSSTHWFFAKSDAADHLPDAPAGHDKFGGDCAGNDISASTKSLADCVAQCGTDEQCQGVSFDASNNRCVLKNAICTKSQIYWSEYRFYAQQSPEGFSRRSGDCAGNDLDPGTHDKASCAIRCRDNSACVGFSFRASNNRCVLKYDTCEDSELNHASYHFYDLRFRSPRFNNFERLGVGSCWNDLNQHPPNTSVSPAEGINHVSCYNACIAAHGAACTGYGVREVCLLYTGGNTGVTKTKNCAVNGNLAGCDSWTGGVCWKISSSAGRRRNLLALSEAPQRKLLSVPSESDALAALADSLKVDAADISITSITEVNTGLYEVLFVVTVHADTAEELETMRTEVRATVYSEDFEVAGFYSVLSTEAPTAAPTPEPTDMPTFNFVAPEAASLSSGYVLSDDEHAMAGSPGQGHSFVLAIDADHTLYRCPKDQNMKFCYACADPSRNAFAKTNRPASITQWFEQDGFTGEAHDGTWSVDANDVLHWVGADQTDYSFQITTKEIRRL